MMNGCVTWKFGVFLLVIFGCITAAWPQLPPGVEFRVAYDKVFVANGRDGTISVINAETNLQTATIDLTDLRGEVRQPYTPRGIQAAPDGRYIYVTAWPTADAGRISVQDPIPSGMGPEALIILDPHTDTLIARIPVSQGLGLTDLVLDSSSRYVYVTASQADAVLQFDTRSRLVVKTFPLGPGRRPQGIRYSRGILYIANFAGKSLSVLNPKTGTVTEVPLGGMAVQPAILLDWIHRRHFVFVSLYDTREVVRYNIADNTLTRIPLPPGAQGPVQLYASPDSQHLFVSDQGLLLGRPSSNRLFDIDVPTASVIATMQVGVGAHGVVVSKDGRRVYVTNVMANTVTVLDVATHRALATIPVGHAPTGITYWYGDGGMP